MGISLIEEWEKEGRLVSPETYDLLRENKAGKYLITSIDSYWTLLEEYTVLKANTRVDQKVLSLTQKITQP